MLAGYSTAMIVYNAITFIDQYSIFDIAIARVMEISIGVIASAVVSATIFPMHIGSAIKQRVSQALRDTELLFVDLFSPAPEKNSQLILAALTRDSTEIHALAVHLNYEKGELKGMTKALQEMLHQLSLVLANLVALSQRLKQLNELPGSDTQQAGLLKDMAAHVVEFLQQQRDSDDEDILKLPSDFESFFEQLATRASVQQRILLAAIKMDMRHFISNVLAVTYLWQRIQRGNKDLPAQITAMTTNYPSLHRDHGVAVRGGISAVFITFIVTGIWIISGWKAGFMMAQIGAVTACILTALDNPVPVLKIFIWGSVLSAVLVFVYAFGVFPHVTAFWQLALVLLPLVLVAVSMMANQALMPIGMVLGINTMMGLNLHNRYSMDAVSYLDSSFGMIMGVLVSLIVIHMVRAMSPDTSASRILALHYRAVRLALDLPYAATFKVHLRSMFDRIGVLNSKPVQSTALQQAIGDALTESSAVVDLARLRELMLLLPPDSPIQQLTQSLQQQLDQFFLDKESNLQADATLQQQLQQQLSRLQHAATDLEDPMLQQRLLISLNNIEYSLCHIKLQPTQYQQASQGEAIHG